MLVNEIQRSFQKALAYLSSPDLKISPYKFISINFYLKTRNFDVQMGEGRNFQFLDEQSFLIYSHDENNFVKSVGIVANEFLILFSPTESKGDHTSLMAYKEGIIGTIPLQFSKDNMLRTLEQEWFGLELWEYRSKKSKAQAYIKDESVDKTDIKIRLYEDRKRGLKPYFASFKIKVLPKKYSFSIYGDGSVIIGAESFPEVVSYVSDIIAQLISYELRIIGFVREVKLAPKPNGLPYISIGATLKIKNEFNVDRFKKSIHSELQVTSSSQNKRDYELTIYDKNLSEFLSLTALQKTVYIFPRTIRESQQENLVASLTYYLDELFGILQS